MKYIESITVYECEGMWESCVHVCARVRRVAHVHAYVRERYS